jgi:transcription elongation GreA/GreB family factor
MPRLDKRVLVQQLVADLEAEIAVLTAAARSAHEAATHEEAKPENDKDTRSVEAAYLAGAQAERVRDLERVSSALSTLPLKEFAADDDVAVSAIVEVSLKGARQWCFIARDGGGRKTRVSGVEIQVVTPVSPLGEALVHARAGEVVEVVTPAGVREYEVCSVQ